MQNYPKISFIIPTYNADRYLQRCLQSIFDLDYPPEKLEVFIADGGSTDNTLMIAKKFNVKILENKRKIAEYGKFFAFQASTGEYIALVDSDNIIASRSWLKKLVTPLILDSTLLGAESNYLIADDFTSLNTYLNLLFITDPLARMVASKPKKIEGFDYNVKEYKIGDEPVSGANGFLWRKNRIINYLKGYDTFEEGNLLSRIAKREAVKFSSVPGVGIYHYYCVSFTEYIKKRTKIAKKFLSRKEKKNRTWVDSVNKLRFFFSVLFLLTLVGPLAEALINWNKSSRVEWLWHPLIGLATIIVYAYNLIASVFLKLK